MKWYQVNLARFEIEKKLLARHHPGVKIVIKDGKVKLTKQIRTNRDTYLIEGRFPKNYPYSPLNITVLKPKLHTKVPHIYCDGELCLHGSGDAGPETTAKIILDWTVQWLKTYERWLDDQSWPTTNHG